MIYFMAELSDNIHHQPCFLWQQKYPPLEPSLYQLYPSLLFCSRNE